MDGLGRAAVRELKQRQRQRPHKVAIFGENAHNSAMPGLSALFFVLPDGRSGAGRVKVTQVAAPPMRPHESSHRWNAALGIRMLRPKRMWGTVPLWTPFRMAAFPTPATRAASGTLYVAGSAERLFALVIS